MRKIIILKLSCLIFTMIGFFAMAQNNNTKPLPQLGKAGINEVIAAMTLEEKVHLLVGMGFRMPGSGGPVIGHTEVKVPGAAGTTYAIPRLGIPSLVLADGPAGIRIDPFRNKDSTKSYYATAWPVATLLASSWDIDLVKKVGIAFGNEVKEYGVDIILAPALNIHRNPLGGRNFEYYSEDPLVAGSMAAAIVNGIQSNGVGTSIKHFAANNQETHRNTVNTIVSERALREIYLKAFQYTVRNSSPWTVMSSYNKINGTYTSENRELLTTILRDEWKYKGFVMTDWFGGINPVAQVNAGNDLLMPGTPDQVQKIINAFKHDSVSIKILDENVEHILKVIALSPAFKGYRYHDKPDLKSHAALSRKAATEGMVLLKNEMTLPLKKEKKLALFGNGSYELIAGGTGSGDVNKAYTVSVMKGFDGMGYNIVTRLTDKYQAYIKEEKSKRPKQRNFFELPPPINEMKFEKNDIEQIATEADAAVITIGRNAGEGNDRKLENDYYLSSDEKELISNVSEVFHAKGKKLVVILNIGGVIETDSWKDRADAILLAWQPGLEGGNAIADVISGKVNPSGKLATTFPAEYKDVPSAKTFPGKEFPDQATTGNFGRKIMPAEVIYEDDIFVGYRYYNTFHVKPSYEFGYGLSYTKFDYASLKLSSARFTNKLTAAVTIKNSGNVAGKEIVEIYLSAPATSLKKPFEELKAFGKTRLLQPGESETINFTITLDLLSSFDPGRSSWIAEAGSYTVRAGASSLDIRKTGTFKLDREIVTEKVHKVLTPQVSIADLMEVK